MESIVRDVTALDDAHRRAIEDVIGQQLKANQRLIIRVSEIDVSSDTAAAGEPRPQSLEDWTGVYVGLSDAQIEAIDRVAKMRADLTRHLP